MILHIFNDQKKFSRNYFQMLIDYGFDIHEHALIHYGKEDDYYQNQGIDTIFIPSFFTLKNCKAAYKKMVEADKIFIHSFASPYFLYLIGKHDDIAAKVFWVIWGKDLYFYKLRKRHHLPDWVYEKLRIKAFSKIRHIIPVLHGDFVRAKEWYSPQACEHENNSLYPYCADIEVRSNSNPSKKSGYNVLLGNSASKTNRHLDALDILKKCDDDVEKIYCPLSYNGGKFYIRKVINKGNKLFGSKFVPLTTFLPKDEYYAIFDSIDIGFFNYNRQEGLGNVYSLIMKKKTVYLAAGTSTYEFMEKNGITVFPADETEGKLRVLTEEELNRNRELLNPLISIDKSVNKWRTVFEMNI